MNVQKQQQIHQRNSGLNEMKKLHEQITKETSRIAFMIQNIEMMNETAESLKDDKELSAKNALFLNQQLNIVKEQYTFLQKELCKQAMEKLSLSDQVNQFTHKNNLIEEGVKQAIEKLSVQSEQDDGIFQQLTSILEAYNSSKSNYVLSANIRSL